MEGGGIQFCTACGNPVSKRQEASIKEGRVERDHETISPSMEGNEAMAKLIRHEELIH